MKKHRKGTSRSPFKRLHYLLHRWDEERVYSAYSSSVIKPGGSIGGRGRENLPDDEAEKSAREFELLCKHLADKLIERIDEWLGNKEDTA